MKKKRANGKGGVTMVEVLVAITVLGIVTAALGGSLVISHRINGLSETLIEDRLAVSAAVETLMAKGITSSLADDVLKEDPSGSGGYTMDEDDFPGLEVVLVPKPDVPATPSTYYQVTVRSGDVSVTTFIRAAH